MEGVDGTETRTGEGRKPTKWPFLYSIEPTVFWGVVLLSYGAATLGLGLWAVLEFRHFVAIVAEFVQTYKLRGH